MTRTHALLAISLLLSANLPAQGRGAAGPPMPFEDVGACPFEGCDYREWTANAPVTIWRERRVGSAVAFKLAKGDKVNAVTGIVITTKPGRVRFNQPLDLWTTGDSIHAKPGDILYLLTYHGEGATTAWFRGHLYDEIDGGDFLMEGECTKTKTCGATVIEQPKSVWWVRVQSPKGIMGWTRETSKFDNKDAYGG